MIKVIHTRSEIREEIKDEKNRGFVPTMGNLHKGHLKLIEESLKNNPITVVSIFVNPTQFGEGEDFTSYPRTLTQDIEKINSISSEDSKIIIFAPSSAKEIYENEISSTLKATGPCNILEGSIRPGHFDGMTTVVYKLFKILSPKNAYFGKKDYQQLCLVQRMVDEQKLSIHIHGVEIIREKSGLALSSRNQYLNESEKEEALILIQTLKEIKNTAHSTKNLKQVNSLIENKLENKKFNYISIKSAESLEDLTELSGKVVLLGNYQIKQTRLLDNIDFTI